MLIYAEDRLDYICLRGHLARLDCGGLGGETPSPPVAKGDNGNGAVALFLILGALVVVGGIMKPKAPSANDQG